MKLNRKKIIAREFLLLLSCFLISGIAYIGVYPYNYVIRLKVDKLEISINPLTDEIQSLEKPVNAKLSKQKWFYDENLKRDATSGYNSYSELWKRLEYLQKSDSIIFKWNNIWDTDLKNLIKEIGFNNVKDFDKFISDNSLKTDELKTIEKVDSIKTEIANIKSQIRIIENKGLDIKDQLNFALLFLLITGIIAFPIRYLIYSIKWSIRTLNQKE